MENDDQRITYYKHDSISTGFAMFHTLKNVGDYETVGMETAMQAWTPVLILDSL